MIEEGSNGPQTKESLVGEGDDDGEQEMTMVNKGMTMVNGHYG